MKTILIAGDSWGCGVFDPWGETGYEYTGLGIHTHLEALGYQVKNISKGGGSNWAIIDRLEGRWDGAGSVFFDKTDKRDKFEWDSVDHIIFLQTDIFREHYYYSKQVPSDNDFKWKLLKTNFINSLLEYDSLESFIDDYFKDFYTKLNEIGEKNNKKILMVGGWSQLHPSIVNYPNLIPAIYSATKLLIPQLKEDLYLSDPEWYDQLDNNEKIMAKFGTEVKQMTIKNAEKLELLYNIWRDVHPDLDGYKIIVDELLPCFG